jgi:hypothetical protein
MNNSETFEFQFQIISFNGFRGKDKLILKTLVFLLNGKYTAYLSKENSILISNSMDGGKKLEKAKEWNISVVNGVWLMELYLGNYYALNEKTDERYLDLDLDHMAYDAIFVQDLMKAWTMPIKIPYHAIGVNDCLIRYVVGRSLSLIYFKDKGKDEDSDNLPLKRRNPSTDVATKRTRYFLFPVNGNAKVPAI